jgi:hypothetical protein
VSMMRTAPPLGTGGEIAPGRGGPMGLEQVPSMQHLGRGGGPGGPGGPPGGGPRVPIGGGGGESGRGRLRSCTCYLYVPSR